MALPVTAAGPVGLAPSSGTETALPSPVGTIFSSGGACCSRTRCATRRLEARITRRKANAYLTLTREVVIPSTSLFFEICQICGATVTTEEAENKLQWTL